MKWITILALTGFFLSMVTGAASHSQQAIQDSRVQPALYEAQQISTELADQVRGLLLQETGKGGFVNAVKVCSEIAQETANRFHRSTGHDVRRVSLKHRNPQNIPDDYERRKLVEFDFLNREKKLEKEYFEVVKENDREYLRYMKPLVTIPLCMNCHGPNENIPSEVKAILKEKYPGDKATGFLAGDIRGAISVKITLPIPNK